jgi:3-deoxy-D-manno-octulosonic acid (KDO) 8-phosphate synthase
MVRRYIKQTCPSELLTSHARTVATKHGARACDVMSMPAYLAALNGLLDKLAAQRVGEPHPGIEEPTQKEQCCPVST